MSEYDVTLIIYAEGYTDNADGEPELDHRLSLEDCPAGAYAQVLAHSRVVLEYYKCGMIEVKMVPMNTVTEEFDWDHEVLLDVLKWENGKVVIEKMYDRMR